MRKFLKLFKEVVLILVIASIIGILLNLKLIKKYFIYEYRENFILFEGNPLPEFITVYEAEELFRTGNALFIDSRSKEEFEKGHIPGAINIPLSSIESEKDLKEINIPKDKLLITYCEGGDCKSSLYLAYLLQKAGFNKVKVLEGGYPKWIENKLPWIE